MPWTGEGRDLLCALALAILGVAAPPSGAQAPKHNHNYRKRYRKRCRQPCSDGTKTVGPVENGGARTVFLKTERAPALALSSAETLRPPALSGAKRLGLNAEVNP